MTKITESRYGQTTDGYPQRRRGNPNFGKPDKGVPTFRPDHQHVLNPLPDIRDRGWIITERRGCQVCGAVWGKMKEAVRR